MGVHIFFWKVGLISLAVFLNLGEVLHKLGPTFIGEEERVRFTFRIIIHKKSWCAGCKNISYTFKSTIIETIVNGERVFRDGKIMSIKNGKKLEFTRG